jgi:2-phosphoglycerate kinase
VSSARGWQVLLIGGASGVGKTSISYRLAQHYGVGITEVDDFQVVLERMTTPEQQPALHHWRLHAAEVLRMDDEQMLEHTLSVAEVLSGAMELVIGNHLASGAPVVLDGDFLLPSLAVRPAYDGIPADGRVRAVFLYEDDEQQFLRNYREREGAEQSRRARASWCYSEWLRAEAERVGVPPIAARPWDTVFDRACVAIEEADRLSWGVAKDEG